MDFVAEQYSSLASGKGHTARERDLSTSQRLLLALSCAAYAVNAHTYSALGFEKMAALFRCVALLSTLADAVSDRGFAPQYLRWIRSSDRAIGSGALFLAVALNSVDLRCALLSVGAALSALFWLGSARRASDDSRWLLYSTPRPRPFRLGTRPADPRCTSCCAVFIACGTFGARTRCVSSPWRRIVAQRPDDWCVLGLLSHATF